LIEVALPPVAGAAALRCSFSFERTFGFMRLPSCGT
jgi:hypothetical protein